MNKKLISTLEVQKFVESALDQIVGEGNYFDCPAFEKYTSNASVNYKVTLYLRSLNKKVTDAELLQMTKLDNDRRHLVLSMKALTQPKDAMAYYKKNKPVSDLDKKTYFIAIKMIQQKDHPDLNKADQEVFKKMVVHQEVRAPIASKIDKQIGQFVFPTKKMKIERYSKVMEDVFYRTKILRKTFIKESVQMPDDQKKNYLLKLADIENKVAQVITDSPRPDGLTEEELVSYNNELTKAAADYTNQAQAYISGQVEIDKHIQEVKAQSDALRVPEIDINKWFWPSGAITETARRLEKEKGAMAALVYLEYQRNGVKIKDPDYFILRGGILLSSQSHEAMRYYVRDELIVSGQSAIVDQWRLIQ